MKLIFRQIEEKLQIYKYQIIIIILALMIRFSLISFVSYDMEFVLYDWYNYIIKNGGFAALKDGFYNYNPPYIYLMIIATYLLKRMSPIIALKLISIMFDFIAAFLAYKIADIKYSKSGRSIFAFIFVLFSPTVVFNSAGWGQSDIIYTSFLLACLYFLLIRKERLALIFFTIAVSFKLQAMFFAPVLFILLLKKYIKWYSFLVIPIVYHITLLPAYFAGRSMTQLLMIYLNQANSDEHLTILAPTLYQWISNEYFELFSSLGLIITTVIILIFSLILYRIKFKLNPEIIIQIALISVTIMPFFLPKMHERYFFAADVISIIFACYYPRYFWIPILIIFSSLMCYYPALTEKVLFPISYLSGIILSVIIILMIHLAQTILQQKKRKNDRILICEI